jgi:hypothetical protein
VGHAPASVHEHPDLPARGAAQLGELAGELMVDQAICRKLAAEETLELANLGGPKALGVSEDPDRWFLVGGKPLDPNLRAEKGQGKR